MLKNQLKCEKHPQYKALRQPQCECKICWEMYNETLKDELRPLYDFSKLKKFLRKQ
jgi:hypothetical protein